MMRVNPLYLQNYALGMLGCEPDHDYAIIARNYNIMCDQDENLPQMSS